MTVRQWHIIRAYATLDELERIYRISEIRQLDAAKPRPRSDG